jgi:hypothetical protein
MKQAQQYFFLAISLLLVACKTTSTVSNLQNMNFSDDVSSFRVKFNPTDTPTQIANTYPHTVQQSSISLQEPVGSVKVALDTLLGQIAESNKSFSVKGYKIQIYSGLDRKEAEKAIADFNNLRVSLEDRPELEYTQPNFKVKVGNYLDKPKAYELYYKIKSIFPSASVIYEKIKIPRYK